MHTQQASLCGSVVYITVKCHHLDRVIETAAGYQTASKLDCAICTCRDEKIIKHGKYLWKNITARWGVRAI